MDNLHTVVWFLTNNSSNLSKWLNSSVWFIDGTLIGIITPGQSGPESNANEEILHILQNSRTRASPSDSV